MKLKLPYHLDGMMLMKHQLERRNVVSVMNVAIYRFTPLSQRARCIERFSFKCRKTKTKVITLTNHNSRKQSNEPIRARSKYMSRATKSRLVLVLLPIGRRSG